MNKLFLNKINKLFLFLIFLSLINAYLVNSQNSGYALPCSTTYGGVEICNLCYDCGADDSVCPNEYGASCNTDPQCCTDGDNDGYYKTGDTLCPGGNDCDDTKSYIHPGATETCDGLDNNCINGVDEGCECIDGNTQQCGTTDVGECGYGTQTCANGAWGTCTGNTEPTAETCDGKDNDCDGSTDEGCPCGWLDSAACYRLYGWARDSHADDGACFPFDSQASSNTLDVHFYYDVLDAAHYLGSTTANRASSDVGAHRFLYQSVVLPDNTPGKTYNIYAFGINTGAQSSGNPQLSGSPKVLTIGTETCNNIDDDCDGSTDESLTTTTGCDQDGYCAGAFKTCSGGKWGTCSKTPGTETCNGIDDDCDGLTDENCVWCCDDDDGDGYLGGATSYEFAMGPFCSGDYETLCSSVDTCTGTEGDYNTPPTCSVECDPADRTPNQADNDATTYPGAPEICDNLDNDCDGTIDSFSVECESDVGECVPGTQTCTASEWSDCTGYVGPTTEICENGYDEDCDGQDNPCNCTDWDGDGFFAYHASTCPDGTDCDDYYGLTYPGATELCDGADNQCSGDTGYGQTDEGYTNLSQSCTVGLGVCAVTESYVCNEAGTGTECSATEGQPTSTDDAVCNGDDDNCNGQTDEDYVSDNTCFLPGACAADNLASSCKDGTETLCSTGTPGTEECNNIDDDCDGTIDGYSESCGYSAGLCVAGTQTCTAAEWSDCTGYVGPTTEICESGYDENCDGKDNACQCEDSDLDTFFAYDASTCPDGNDCDDDEAGTYPGADEVCDTQDNDCDPDTEDGYDETPQYNAKQDGVCAGSIKSCDASGNMEDDYSGVTKYEATETSCDALDNDCDGQTNEDLIHAAHAPDNTNQNGVCSGSKQSCDSTHTSWYDHYSDLLDYEATETSCDDKDNDCDGSTDESLTRATTCGVGACAGNTGIKTCTDAGGWTGDTCDPLAGATTETCNDADDDCDGTVDEGVKTTFYQDSDSDTYGNPSQTTQACSAPTGYVSDNTDCDDTDSAINPGATETCNGINDDCDAETDEGCVWCCDDDDNDGYVSGASYEFVMDCSQTSGGKGWKESVCSSLPTTYGGGCTINGGYGVPPTCAVECDPDLAGPKGPNDADGDAGTYPGAPEICDNYDNDCDGTIDSFSVDCESDVGECVAGTQTCTANVWSDCIGYVGPTTEICENDKDEDCDGIDNACTCEDNDGDTYYAYHASTCPDGNDCDDINPYVYPDAPEECDTIDNQCPGDTGYGQVDEGYTVTCYSDSECNHLDGCDSGTYYDYSCDKPTQCDSDCKSTTSITDVDGDGQDTECDGDCDDTNPDIYLGATETCNGEDDDCDGTVDEGVKSTFYLDSDDDGYGDPTQTTEACSAPTGYVSNSQDCDDTNPAIKPGATEVCNDMDDNCDGDVDEGVKNTFYQDSDSDTYGNPSQTTQACSAPTGYVSDNTDCNDTNEFIYPGAPEICNDVDDDCDTQIDEDLTTTCGTNQGICSTGTATCFQGDWINCDAVWGTTETTQTYCDGIDQECKGSDTCGCDDTGDYDGYNATDPTCPNGNDCKPFDYFVNPGAAEVCDSQDNNCNGQTDEGLTIKCSSETDCGTDGCDSGTYYDYSCNNAGTCYSSCDTSTSITDLDNDGYDTECDNDCDDTNADINPGAADICNGIDDDCNALTTDGSGETTPLNTKQDTICAGSTKSCIYGSWLDDYSYISDYEETETTCNDGEDNDCDNVADCTDLDCMGQLGPTGGKCCQTNDDCGDHELCDANNECIDAKTGQGECCLNYCECLGAVELYSSQGGSSCVSEISILPQCNPHDIVTITYGDCIDERADSSGTGLCIDEIKATTAYDDCIQQK